MLSFPWSYKPLTRPSLASSTLCKGRRRQTRPDPFPRERVGSDLGTRLSETRLYSRSRARPYVYVRTYVRICTSRARVTFTSADEKLLPSNMYKGHQTRVNSLEHGPVARTS